MYKYDHSKIKLAVKPLAPYFSNNHDKATKAHQHSYYQIILFSEAGRHYVDYQVMDHVANTIYVLRPGQIHYFCPDSRNEGTIIQFNEQFLVRFDPTSRDAIEYALFNDVFPESFILDSHVLIKVEQLIHQIEAELHDRLPHYPSQSYYLLRSLITLLERAQDTQREGSQEKEKDFEVAIRFKRLISEHIGSFPSLKEYGDWLLTSTKTLNRISKQYLNDTPANVIRKRKILEAKRLLANKGLTVKQVGYALGFDEPSNFTKYFHKIEGIKPKQFQQQIP